MYLTLIKRWILVFCLLQNVDKILSNTSLGEQNKYKHHAFKAREKF